MLTFRKLIIIVLVIVLVIGVVYGLTRVFGQRQKERERLAETAPSAVVAPSLELPTNAQLPEDLRLLNDQVTSDGELEILPLAFSFTERFGSYSTASAGKNLRDLKPVMTESMRAWVDQLTFNNQTDIIGVTTKAVSTDIVDEAPNRATVTITTQRSETTVGAVAARMYYQELSLVLVKEAAGWLVDEAKWQTVK